MSQPIKVCAYGGVSPLSQIDRIKQGLAAQPNILLTEDPSEADLIYANDPGSYEHVLQTRAAGWVKPSVKVIFNVLDIPVHLLPPNGDYTFEKLAKLGEQLAQADAITSISLFVQGQLQQMLGLGSTVVYNPIKDVSPEKRLNGERPYPYRVLIAGRVGDPNKRVGSLAIPALIRAGFEESEVAVVGGEHVGWGRHLGVVSNAILNDLYNSVDFVMATSMLEGLGLVPLEGMVCGAIPIVCSDLTTVSEFYYPHFWRCHPSPTMIAYHLKVRLDNAHVLEADRNHCLTMSESIVELLGKEAVARRIVSVYKHITNSSSHD